jgi:hypothetical protein
LEKHPQLGRQYWTWSKINILKMGWASRAIEHGVERANIINCEDGALLEELFTARQGYGTCISQDDYEAPHSTSFERLEWWFRCCWWIECRHDGTIINGDWELYCTAATDI